MKEYCNEKCAISFATFVIISRQPQIKYFTTRKRASRRAQAGKPFIKIRLAGFHVAFIYRIDATS